MSADRARIAALNDALRRTLGMASDSPVRGRVMLSRALAALPTSTLAAVLSAVRRFSTFTPDNDPWNEHDCARLQVAGESVIWKVDYFADDSLTAGAEDASDPARCYRVLTIMLASDY